MGDLSSSHKGEAFENDEQSVVGTQNNSAHAIASRACSRQEGHGVVGALVPLLDCEAERKQQLVDAAEEEKKDAPMTASASTKDPFSWLQEVVPTKKLNSRIEVVVRIRPASDPMAYRTTRVLPDGKTLRLLTCPPRTSKEPLDQGRQKRDSRSSKELQITFDCALDEGATQNELYEEVCSCVSAPFHGVNACIFAYGQTGSGKTHTMIGDHTISLTTSAELSQNSMFDVNKPVARSIKTWNAVPSVNQRVESPPAATSEGRRHGSELRAGDGVIPRAVADLFRYVQQCQEGGADVATTAATGNSREKQSDRFGRHSDSTIVCSAIDRRNKTRTSSTSGMSAGSSSGDERRSGRDPFLSADDPMEAPRAPTWSVNDVQQGPCEKAKEAEDEGSGMEGQRSCTIECSYMQVYNGLVYDLLADHADDLRPLPVRQSTGLSRERNVELKHADDDSDHKKSDDDPLSSGRGGSRKSLSGENSVSVVGLSSHPVECPREVLELLSHGQQLRRVRSTAMNASSSRSHTIVQFTVSRTIPLETPSVRDHQVEPNPSENNDISHSCDRLDSVGDGSSQSNSASLNSFIGGNRLSGRCTPREVMKTRARLCLVDLAGSEKGGRAACRGSVEGEGQERERLKINSSLSALSNCISCLGETGRTHVPFRDNPLTRLLQDSLSRGKTVVIATINPSLDTQEESISTLSFAARCMRVTVRHRVNEVTTDAVLLHRARRQISFLRRRLREIENGNSSFCKTNITRHSDVTATAADSARHLTTRETSPNACGQDSQFTDERGRSHEPINKSDRKDNPIEQNKSGGIADNTPSERDRMSLALRRHVFPAGTSSDARRATETKICTNSSGNSGNPDGGSRDVARKSSRAYASRQKPGVKRTCEGIQTKVSQRWRCFPVRGNDNSADDDGNSVVVGDGCGSSTNRLLSHGIPRRNEIRRANSRKSMAVGEGDNVEALATKALIERFSCREGELLRELETWKTRCSCLQDDAKSSFTTGKEYCNDQQRGCTPLTDVEVVGHSFSPRTSSSSSVQLVRTSTTADTSSLREHVNATSQHICRSGAYASSEACSCQDIDHNKYSGKNSQSKVGEDAECELEQGGGVIPAEEPGSRWALALYDLKAEQEGDFELRGGDAIEVLNRRSDGWWYGRNRNSDLTGIFPSNFVRQISEAELRLMSHKITGTTTMCTSNSRPSRRGERATEDDQDGEFRSSTPLLEIQHKFESRNEAHTDDVRTTGDGFEVSGIMRVINGNAAIATGGFVNNICYPRVELASRNSRESKNDQETVFTGQWPFGEHILHSTVDGGSDSPYTQFSRSGYSGGTDGGTANGQHTNFVRSSVSHDRPVRDESPRYSCSFSSSDSRDSRSAGFDGDHKTNSGGDDAAMDDVEGNMCHVLNAAVESPSFAQPRQAKRAVAPNIFVKEAPNTQQNDPVNSWNNTAATMDSTFPTQSRGDLSPVRRTRLRVSPNRLSSTDGAVSIDSAQAANGSGQGGCSQHGIPSCILCTGPARSGERLCSLPDEAWSIHSTAGRMGYSTDILNPRTMTNSSTNDGSVADFTVAGTVDLRQSSVESRRLQFPSSRHSDIVQQHGMDSHQHQRLDQSTMCKRHLLLNCILCKMTRSEHPLCRSVSLPALEHGAGSEGTDCSLTASPKPSLNNPCSPKVSNPTSEKLCSNLCERHSLRNCCLCGGTSDQVPMASLPGSVAVGAAQLQSLLPVQAPSVFLPKGDVSSRVYGSSSPPLKVFPGPPAHCFPGVHCGADVSVLEGNRNEKFFTQPGLADSSTVADSSPLTLASTANQASPGGHQSRTRFLTLTALDAHRPRQQVKLAEHSAASMFSDKPKSSTTGMNANSDSTRIINCYNPPRGTGLHQVVDKVREEGGIVTDMAILSKSAERAAHRIPGREASMGRTRRRKRASRSSSVRRNRGEKALADTVASGARARLKGSKYGGGCENLAKTAMTAATVTFRC